MNNDKLENAQAAALTIWTAFNRFVVSVIDGRLNDLENDMVSFDYICRDLKEKLEDIISLKK